MKRSIFTCILVVLVSGCTGVTPSLHQVAMDMEQYHGNAASVRTRYYSYTCDQVTLLTRDSISLINAQGMVTQRVDFSLTGQTNTLTLYNLDFSTNDNFLLKYQFGISLFSIGKATESENGNKWVYQEAEVSNGNIIAEIECERNKPGEITTQYYYYTNSSRFLSMRERRKYNNAGNITEETIDYFRPSIEKMQIRHYYHGGLRAGGELTSIRDKATNHSSISYVYPDPQTRVITTYTGDKKVSVTIQNYDSHSNLITETQYYAFSKGLIPMRIVSNEIIYKK